MQVFRIHVFVHAILFSLAAIAAHPFAILDKEADGIAKIRPVFVMSEAFSQYRPDEQAELRGFWATAVDLNMNLSKEFNWAAPTLNNTMQLLTAQGDYTCAAFSVFFAKEAPKLEIISSELKSRNHVIPVSETCVLQISPAKSVPRFPYCNLMWEPVTNDMKPGDQLNLVYMVNVSADTPAGLYKSQVTLVANGQQMALNVELRVADFTLPECGNFGFFLNGNLYQPRDGYNCNQKAFVKENLKLYFNYFKTRRFNSISIFDNLPDLRYIDGKVTGNFSDMSAIAAAMNASGLKGKLLIDLRDIGYWCNAVAIKLEELGNKVTAGDLGVTMVQRKPSIEPYPEKAKELYAESIRLLIAQAKAEHWPDIRIFADEELGNQFPLKINNYECFMPVIMKEFAEYAAVIDNGIGWGRKTATEYAARDQVRHRQYNSWTEEALANAEAENAEVWTFNYATSRLANGFLQSRMNSKGHHQWADLWDASNFQWQFTRLSPKGVVTSLNAEWMHEGCVDYAACEYLKTLIAECEAAGNTTLAAEGKAVLAEIFRDLSVNHTTAQNYGQMMPNSALSAWRWLVFQAIEKLQDGHFTAATVGDGKPSMRLEPTKQITVPNNDYILKVKNMDGIFQETAETPEDFWSEFIGPFSHLTEYEAQLRAFCSTPEEFKAKNAPSYTMARVASIPAGLAIYTYANHVQPKDPYRYERQDDDGDMWQDDCIEFFFGFPNGKHAHLMYNSAGKKTFFYGGQVIPAEDKIKSFIKSPINVTGGTINKMLIPWSYFGLTLQPLPGTVWEFNVGREMHTFRTPTEAPMSWARLATSFHEQDKWGRLVFTGSDGVSNVKAEPSLMVEPSLAKMVTVGLPFPFNMEIRADVQILSLDVTLVHEDGTEVALETIKAPVGSSRLVIETAGLKLGSWTLYPRISQKPVAPSNVVSFRVVDSPWK
ncbi:MAG: hypothetical protein GX946_02115 [Oligosphaeraceae bacterium]|nr:hypothetical protein [Oligosphaeraceae bacterium]